MKSRDITEDIFSAGCIKRLTVLVTCMCVIGLALMVRLADVMLVRGKQYNDKAVSLWERERSIKAKRGIIYDRNGVVLASNKPVCSISVIHSQIEDSEQIIDILSDKLSLDREYVEKRVYKISSREKIKSNVDKVVADEIRELNLPGVMVDEDYKRYYPYDTLASKIIGFTGGDNQGVVGLEVYYDDMLMGTPGSINTVTDARGREIPGVAENRINPIPGNNLITTIDINIQKYIEQEALTVLKKKNAKRVCIIVMNPQNGEIYGLTDVPEYNLNEPFSLNYTVEEGTEVTQDMLNSMWRCFPVCDTYEPGSTFKIVTSTAAFEAGVLHVDDGFYCPGYKIVEDRKIRCHKTAGHGQETFREGIMNSCNPVFMTVGERVGVDGFYENLQTLGLFDKTGVDITGEANSIFHKKENVGPVELATMTFGQSFQITPLQLMRAVACVINGGTLVTPHFGLYETDNNNNIIRKLEYSHLDSVISKETSDTMKSLLHDVVEEGTGHRAFIEGFSIGGKTATSEKLPRRSGKYISSFIGFAPADNPQVLTLILIDEPEGVYYGGTIAAPVVGKIYENILPYLGIDKEMEETDEDGTEVLYIDDTVF